jgi:hypothetical protein
VHSSKIASARFFAEIFGLTVTQFAEAEGRRHQESHSGDDSVAESVTNGGRVSPVEKVGVGPPERSPRRPGSPFQTELFRMPSCGSIFHELLFHSNAEGVE